ncbi:FHA domain-containing protein PS1 [Spatholobus suberectus]|nr:FHA domain-containing protein PS1 [Spatholobus suberectus]
MAAIAMAEKNNNKNPEQEERAIVPVLTVLKNNAILKNIFIVLDDDNEDQTVLIGRHPDCNVVLTHPSVSRFHLRIGSNPSSRTLSLVDLASVHGTWVHGRKLEPRVSVELKEGDTFTVGVSTRLYLLSWVPLTQLDGSVPQQEEKDDEEGEIIKDENLELTVEQEIPMPEDIVSICCDEERKSHSEDEAFGVLNGTETSCFPTNSGGENILCDCQSHVLSPPYVQSVGELDNTEKIEACPEVEMPGETNLLCTLREYLTHNICLPVVEAVQGTKMPQFQAPPDTFTGQPTSLEMHRSSLPTNVDPASFDEEDVAAVAVIPTEPEYGCTHGDNDKVEDIFNSENTHLIVDEVITDSKFHQIKVVEEVSVDSVPDGEKQGECKEEYKSKLQDLNAKSCCKEEYSLDEIVEDNGNKCIKNIDPASFNEKGLAAVTVIPTESEFGCTIRDNERIEDILATESRIINSENSSLLDEEAIPITKFQLIEIVEEVAMDSISDGEKEDKCGKELKSKLQASLNAKSCQEQGNSVDEIAEDTGNRCARSISSVSFQVESPNSSMPQEAVLNPTNKVENQNPQSLTSVTGCSGRDILENHVESTVKSSTLGNIWSRRGKVASAPQVRASKSRFMSTSKIDTEVKMNSVKIVINKPMPKDLSSVFDEEEETFTPNKENLSPNTYHLWFMRKKGKLEEIKHSMSKRSPYLNTNFSPSIYSAKSISAVSNKVNQTPKVAQEWRRPRRKPLECRINLAHEQDMMELKKNKVERVPFESLPNSGGGRKSVTVSAAKSIDDARICGQISSKCIKPSHISREQKRSWDMVVDTASLLNKESRKALQLLRGLKGTRLIIPRLVIRELGSMKQQFRILRRTSEASLALEWIEECMEKTRWWIQIQSSMEECRLTAPTAPASPQTHFIEESWAFPGFKSSKECVSPTLEDHTLDCALQYRRKENVGQLVLLSDDVTLKIKSMAKGLLCETVQQFRQSLVNPFSERFMWPNSSPRGLTWSCQDDLVLREKYCGLPSKAGLKFITEQFL